MANLDRFQPPAPHEEPTAICASCGAERPAADLLFDEYAEVYLCDRRCFDDWHSDNFDLVGDYYYRMNIEY